MISTRRARSTVLASTAAGLMIAASTALGGQAPQEIDRNGVGEIQLGDKASQLREAGLIGATHRGCELGVGTKAADLEAPLEGSVNLSTDRPRVVENILILGGGEARGVGILDRKRKLKNKFPGVKFDRSTIDVFGIILATVPKRAGGKIQFTIHPDDKRILSIGVPFIPFCE
jgi:hypothetical protein